MVDTTPAEAIEKFREGNCVPGTFIHSLSADQEHSFLDFWCDIVRSFSDVSLATSKLTSEERTSKSKHT